MGPRNETADSAWHEAGHVVAASALGLDVMLVRLGDGATQLDPVKLGHAYERDGYRNVHRRVLVQVLAADVVDVRREAKAGGHVLRVRDEVEAAVFEELWAEAARIVDERWETIATIAAALLSSPRRMLGAEELEALRAKG